MKLNNSIDLMATGDSSIYDKYIADRGRVLLQPDHAPSVLSFLLRAECVGRFPHHPRHPHPPPRHSPQHCQTRSRRWW